MSLPTTDEIKEAVRRIALTSDGALLYRLLQLELMSVPATTDSGALQSSHGRRTFARELKLLMDEELAKVANERVNRSGPHDPDAPAVVERGKSVAAARGSGIARRIQPYADDPKPT